MGSENAQSIAEQKLIAGDIDTQKHLTWDSAAELLEELRHAYQDTAFQKQVAKLARDVRWDENEFVFKLRRFAMDIQQPILKRWGFDASPRGILEVELALREHTTGQKR